jgi:uncharacterized DUF497 family protein
MKELRNISKHGVSFESARSVLLHSLSVTLPDTEHSKPGEQRWLTIGYSEDSNLLVVVHTWNELTPMSARARIISARKATPEEIRQFEEAQ